MQNEDQIMQSIKCKYLSCAGGGGVAGNLKCFLGGDYTDPDCSKFELEPEDSEIEAAIKEEKNNPVKFLSHKESNDILVEENRKLKEQLKSMECCGNCDNERDIGDSCKVRSKGYGQKNCDWKSPESPV